MATTLARLDRMTLDELSDAIQRIGDELGKRSDPESLAALVDSTIKLGIAMGAHWSGRSAADGGSWAVQSAGWASAGWSPSFIADSFTSDSFTPEVPPAATAYPFTMFGIHEKTPGERWRGLFQATWPGYRTWFLSEGEAARADLATCRAMLEEHMPELVSTWEQMVQLAGGDETAARMLTLWQPPQFLPGCSQAVVTGDRPVLVRNYDYSPELFEQVCYSSEFTGRKVIGTGDCLWGLLDGMNEDGLVVSLTFGGRPGSGPGFGIPLVVRYLLETAATVEEACEILERLPVSMSYNLTIADASGETRTAYVSPGRDPEFSDAPVATNHRGETPEYPEHARSLRSVERQLHLLTMLQNRVDRDDLAAAFLQPPLYSTGYSKAFGTLYTAVYRPEEGSVEYLWPDTSWRRTFDSPDATKDVVLSGT